MNPLDYDALIIPGGDLEPIVNLEEELFLLVKKFADLGKSIAAICSGGGYILAKAGLLNERLYTVTLTKNKGTSWVVFKKKTFNINRLLFLII